MADYVNGSKIGDASNTLSGAYGLSGSSDSSISGTVGVGYSGDLFDYYRFVADTSGTAQLNMSGLTAEIDLMLLGSVGNVLVSFSNGGNTSESITYAVAAGSTYYVKVAPGNELQYSSYTLSIDIPNPSVPVVPVVPVVDAGDDYVDGIYIGDASNSRSRATIFSGNSNISGTIGGSDSDDYYKFIAPARGVAQFELSGLSSDVDLFLLDSSGNVLDASTNGGTSGESIDFDISAGSTYYLQVNPYDGSSDYSLSVIMPSADDFVDGNNIGDAANSRETAYNLSGITTGIINGTVGGSDSSDYFKFVADYSAAVDIDLAGLTADADLLLMDYNGDVVASSRSGGTDGEYISYDEVAAGRTYYVQIGAFNGVTSYDLNVELSANVVIQSIYGTSAIDTIGYNYTRDEFDISQNVSDSMSGILGSEGWIVDFTDNSSEAGSPSATDYLFDYERISFADTNVALDLNPDDNAGAALALLYAGFNDVPDADTFGLWVAESDNIASSSSKNGVAHIEALAQVMLDYYLPPQGIGTDSLVDLLYTNVVGSAPSESVRQSFVGLVESGSYSQAGLLSLAAESELNTDRYIDLIGSGLEYTSYDSKGG